MQVLRNREPGAVVLQRPNILRPFQPLVGRLFAVPAHLARMRLADLEQRLQQGSRRGSVTAQTDHSSRSQARFIQRYREHSVRGDVAAHPIDAKLYTIPAVVVANGCRERNRTREVDFGRGQPRHPRNQESIPFNAFMKRVQHRAFQVGAGRQPVGVRRRQRFFPRPFGNCR